jgi:hypothetical protein
MSNHRKQITTTINEDYIKNIKYLAIVEECAMNDIIEKIFHDYFSRNPVKQGTFLGHKAIKKTR